MKRGLAFLAIALALAGILAVSAHAGQVTCGTTPTALYTTNSPYRSLIFENQTPGVSVYIDVNPSLTTSTAGILLGAATVPGIVITGTPTAGPETWYCITGSGSATVGVTVRKF